MENLKNYLDEVNQALDNYCERNHLAKLYDKQPWQQDYVNEGCAYLQVMEYTTNDNDRIGLWIEMTPIKPEESVYATMDLKLSFNDVMMDQVVSQDKLVQKAYDLVTDLKDKNSDTKPLFEDHMNFFDGAGGRGPWGKNLWWEVVEILDHDCFIEDFKEPMDKFVQQYKNQDHSKEWEY